jgi:hypothetical protein
MLSSEQQGKKIGKPVSTFSSIYLFTWMNTEHNQVLYRGLCLSHIFQCFYFLSDVHRKPQNAPNQSLDSNISSINSTNSSTSNFSLTSEESTDQSAVPELGNIYLLLLPLSFGILKHRILCNFLFSFVAMTVIL